MNSEAAMTDDAKTAEQILGEEIANVGYLVGCGLAPHPDTLAEMVAKIRSPSERERQLEAALRESNALMAESRSMFEPGSERNREWREQFKVVFAKNSALLAGGKQT